MTFIYFFQNVNIWPLRYQPKGREVYIFKFLFSYFSLQELPIPFPGPSTVRGRGSHFLSSFPTPLPLRWFLQSSQYMDKLRKGGVSIYPSTGFFHFIYVVAIVILIIETALITLIMVISIPLHCNNKQKTLQIPPRMLVYKLNKRINLFFYIHLQSPLSLHSPLAILIGYIN